MWRQTTALFLLGAILLTACSSTEAIHITSSDTVASPASAGPSQRVSNADPLEKTGPPHRFSEPLSREKKMVRGPVYLEDCGILQEGSCPVKVKLNLKGALPTPCHKLRVNIADPDDQNRIQIEVYSILEPADAICAQVLAPFEKLVPLGSFYDGEYSVWVNGQMVGKFGL